MSTWPVFDDRDDPSQTMRSPVDRRRNKILFHLMKLPLRDSDGHLVTEDRRSGKDRRRD